MHFLNTKKKMITEKEIVEILKKFEQQDYKRGGVSIAPTNYDAIARTIAKKRSMPDIRLSLPDAEQCLIIQEQVKQYCYTGQDDKPVISSGGIRAIISRWNQMLG